MTDLIKKLRSQIGDDVSHIYDKEALFREAADEIERLTARIAALEAENARMRDALRFYSCHDGCNGCSENERDLIGCGWTARAALAADAAGGEG